MHTKRDWFDGLALVLILLLAAWLRLAHAADNPGWFSDEGTQLELARQALHGRAQYFAITQSTLLFSRLPLFTAVLAAAARLGGLSMTTLRLLSGSLGMLTVGLVYGLARWGFGRRPLALLAALLLAVYPTAVLYARFGFSYNLLAPLLLGAIWSLGMYRRDGRASWLALSALCLGLGTLTDLLALAFVPVWLLVAAAKNWRAAVWGGLLLALPLGTYTAVSLLRAPAACWFDLDFVLFRISPDGPQQLRLLADNLRTLPAQDAWLVWGLAGLLLLRPAAWRRLLLAFTLIPLLILGRTSPLFSLSAYYLIPFLPLMALGAASLVFTGLEIAAKFARLPKALGWGLALLLAAWSAAPVIGQVNGRFLSPIDPFLLAGPDARAAAAFVNGRLAADDLVIASPTLGWALHGRVADFQMAVAADGAATPHLPADLPPARLAFDPRFGAARFVVVDPLWRSWAQIHVPGLTAVLDAITHIWPEVFRAGEIQVYENPAVRPGPLARP